MDTATSRTDAVVDAYLSTWNCSDPAARSELLDRFWTEDASYVDPLAEGDGRDALAAIMSAVGRQFPGFTFSLIGTPDAHHQHIRFQWGLGPDGDEPVVIGFDVLSTDTDGRIGRVIGFLDKVPS